MPDAELDRILADLLRRREELARIRFTTDDVPPPPAVEPVPDVIKPDDAAELTRPIG